MSALQKKLETPMGDIYIVASEHGLEQLNWKKYAAPMMREGERSTAALILNKTEKQLQEYFQGKRKAFDLPLNLEGTEFQKRVWTSLMTIPYGETWSYKELAGSIKNAKACRAVGTANGHNPIAIIIPCHRVISADGGLGGYSSGLQRKVKLLALEGIHFQIP